MVLAATFSCSTSPTKKPSRPILVSDQGFWTGGADGGYWYTISDVKSKKVAKLIVQAEGNGATIALLHIESNCDINLSFRSCLGGYDGVTLHSKCDSCYYNITSTDDM